MKKILCIGISLIGMTTVFAQDTSYGMHGDTLVSVIETKKALVKNQSDFNFKKISADKIEQLLHQGFCLDTLVLSTNMPSIAGLFFDIHQKKVVILQKINGNRGQLFSLVATDFPLGQKSYYVFDWGKIIVLLFFLSVNALLFFPLRVDYREGKKLTSLMYVPVLIPAALIAGVTIFVCTIIFTPDNSAKDLGKITLIASLISFLYLLAVSIMLDNKSKRIQQS